MEIFFKGTCVAVCVASRFVLGRTIGGASFPLSRSFKGAFFVPTPCFAFAQDRHIGLFTRLSHTLLHHYCKSFALFNSQGMVLVLTDRVLFWVDIAMLDSDVLDHLSPYMI